MDKITKTLMSHEFVSVLWWRHSLPNRPDYVRSMEVGPFRETPLKEGDVEVFYTTCEYRGSEHGTRMEYRAASKKALAAANAECAACGGTGIRTRVYSDGIVVQGVCECTDGRVKYVEHLGTLREVSLGIGGR